MLKIKTKSVTHSFVVDGGNKDSKLSSCVSDCVEMLVTHMNASMS